jgi:hypothetical protein
MTLADLVNIEEKHEYIVTYRAVTIQRQREKQNTRAVSGQRLGKQVPVVTDAHETIEVLLETLFSTRSV